MPTGASSWAINVSTPSGSAWWRGPGKPPQTRSGASDQMPTSASNSTTISRSVSIARYAIRTAVTGFPRPVAAMFAAACGASVGAGSGNSSTIAASPAATTVQSAAAASRRIAPGFSPAATVSARRKRVLAPSSSPPVTPLPSAASVSATSGAARRTQTSARSRPKATKPITAANASRAAMIHTAIPRTNTARPMSRAKAIRQAGGPPGRAVCAISWVTVAPASKASNQMPMNFSATNNPSA